MDLGLQGKRALVLAASDGLGFATAQALAGEGARVMLCSRDAARAEAAAERIGHGALGLAADVAEPEDLARLFARVGEHLGGLDVLVCNAGGPPPGAFAALDDAAWERAFGLTLMSVVRSVRLALPLMERGAILALASSSVRAPIAGLTLSNALRPAVAGLCKDLSVELAPHIRVNVLSPGRIDTARLRALDEDRAARLDRSFENVRAESVAQIPLGRLGTPEEFGRMAAFLCSDAASYLTGAHLLLDGGSLRAH